MFDRGETVQLWSPVDQLWRNPAAIGGSKSINDLIVCDRAMFERGDQRSEPLSLGFALYHDPPAPGVQPAFPGNEV